MSDYEFLKPWSFPHNYFVHDYSGYYPVYGKTRDCGIADDCNLTTLVDFIKSKNELGEGGYYVHRHNLWSNGWVDALYVRMDQPEEVLEEIDQMLHAIREHTFLDDQAYYAGIAEKVDERWAHWSTDERMHFCEEAGVSKFAARRDDVDKLPSDLRNFLSSHVEENYG